MTVCMHEAGHAIVQLATGPGSPIEFIEINLGGPDHNGQVRSETLWQPYYREVKTIPAEILTMWRRDAIRDLVNILAGPMAEERWNGYSPTKLRQAAPRLAYRCMTADRDAIDDSGYTHNRLNWLTPGNEHKSFVKAWLATERIVAGWWAEINELAQVLAEHRYIEYELIDDIWQKMSIRRGEAALAKAREAAIWMQP